MDTFGTHRSGFRDIGVADWLCRHISCVGLSRPTEVQKYCIPPILEGRDCIGCSATGSGKTAAFALPIVQKLSEDPFGVFAIVITPTRELAFLVSEQFNIFGKMIGIKTAVFVGREDMMKQKSLLVQCPHIVVATPGRLADLLHSTHCHSLHNIKFLVLDEADYLLKSSFSADLEKIFKKLPTTRQTLLFSATMTDAMKELFETSRNNVFGWNNSIISMVNLDQRYVLTPEKVKECYFIEVMQSLLEFGPQPLIIFTHTCRACEVVSVLLQRHSIPCVALHSLLTQSQRLTSILKFKSCQVHILVATDVASRGLDIPEVGYVINLNVPASPVDYVHRVGRAARAGKCGISLTFVTQFDISRLKNIEEYIGCSLTEFRIKEEEAVKSLHQVGKHGREIKLMFHRKAKRKYEEGRESQKSAKETFKH